MLNRYFTALIIPIAIGVLMIVVILRGAVVGADGAGALIVSRDPFGYLRTFTTNGAFDLDNPFFKDLGTNGRTCFTCHRPDQGWTITPEGVRARFIESRGLDPIFRNNDGANCEGADVGTLPATNLRFVSAVMWDGRESSVTTTIVQDLAHQADAATMGHAQAVRHLTDREKQALVAFETALFTAQAVSDDAGLLRADGGNGGPVALSAQPFFIGINDPVGLNPTVEPFDPRAFSLFDAWMNASQAPRDIRRTRRAIARGQDVFNTKPIVIAGVAGLNSQTFPNGVTVPDSFTGTCTTCHDTPNAGNHSVKAPLDIGLTAVGRRTADLPLYTLRRLSTGETTQTTDPGRAMVTGKWADIGRFKGPILRGLAARAPYFHNGSAATLNEVVDFYESRFTLGLTSQERSDLLAFLRVL